MKYVLDTHTHTIESGHAYSTLIENLKWACKKGLKILCTTDHGPAMPGGPHEFYFGNLKVLPLHMEGIIHLKGCEANIMDIDGNLDISNRFQERLDIIIASLHDVCITPRSREENTRALIKVMDNPLVDIIGHPGNPSFPIFEEELVKKAKEKNVLIEINNSSFRSRLGSEDNCIKIASLCKEYGANIVMGSDAHICYDIGGFDKSEAILKKVNMPEELIINLDENRLINYLKEKGKLKDYKL
ncbi:phosphatase [Clostridium sp. MSJ-4]|uniref:Phosphatase n=1 Tax=Clostridium simiarum TaxID=2841506 RepID=A0ABS6F247_9CLOT|nr:phosphatase [Clostridium simiarum]MBU5592591.1 phosphatase [Clostridium simiarum]